MQLDLAPSPPPLEDIIARRRARQQAILAKHAAAAPTVAQPASPALSLSGLALGAGSSGAPPTPIPAHVVEKIQVSRGASDTPEPMADTNQNGRQTSPGTENGGSRLHPTFHSRTSPYPSGQATPASSGGTFSLTKVNNAAAPLSITTDVNDGTGDDGTGMQVSAAEYDPTLDWREDQARRAAHKGQVEIADGIGERDEQGGTAIGQQEDDTMDVEEEDEDLDDMFAVGSRKIKLTLPVSCPFSWRWAGLLTSI
jgi:serine/threonine-protein kinase PRP4